MVCETIWWLSMKNLKPILMNSDTTMVRLILGMSSLLWSIMLFWPGDTFGRPTYALMEKWFSEEVWASLYLVHAITAIISVLFKQVKYFSVLSEGVLGCFMWSSSCFLMLLSVYPPPAAISAEIVVAFASWWVLARYPVVHGGK